MAGYATAWRVRVAKGSLYRGLALAGLTLAAFALRFYRLGALPLFGDEAYYLLWADRLAPAYWDHPAGIALLLKLSTAVGGHSEVGVRWLNALLSVACVPLAYAVGRRYVSAWGGMIAATVVAIGPAYVITGRVAYPDSVQAFLMLVNLLAFAPLIMPSRPSSELPGTTRAGRPGPTRLLAWAWFGLTLALLLNVKLSSGFYAAALGTYLLIWRRDLFLERGLWMAALIVAFGLIPFAAWNVTHDWATVRWALWHARGFDLGRKRLPASLAHAWDYFSPPVALLGLAALVSAALSWRNLRAASWRSGAGPRPEPGASPTEPANGNRPLLLMLVAAFLLLPVLLSAADSPRNLGIGLLALWALAGMHITGRDGAWRVSAGLSATRLAQVVLCVLMALYGLGTVAALLGPTRLPHSGAPTAIRWDAAGWHQFAAVFDPPAGSTVFAVDYSVAGQLTHYAARPVHTSAGQFRLWGVPDFDNLTVLASDFLPPELITDRLLADFTSVSGPDTWRYDDAELDKAINIWQATGRQVALDQVLDDLDYLNLARKAGMTLH